MIWGLLLFVAGLFLIVAEFIVPGLICGILGTVLVISSAVLLIQAFPDAILLILVGELLGLLFAVVGGMYLLSRTRAAKGLILESSQQADSGWVASETDTDLLGRTGEAFTVLRPAGTIVVDGKRVDAVSSGEHIEKGSTIRVIETQGSRVVVEKVSE